MGEPDQEHRWHAAIERLGPDIVRSKLEAQPADSVSDASPGLGALPPLPVADVTLHADDSASDPDSSGTHPLRYWLAVGGAAGLIAALIGLLALLPMSVR